jgi:1-deoxy-D-xylulose-5-phosphate synthase
MNPVVCDMRFLKPLDTEMIDSVASRCTHVAIIEENSVIGGLCSAVIEYLHLRHPEVRALPLGIPDSFVTHGAMDELYREIGLDAVSLSDRILEFTGRSRKAEEAAQA